MSYLIFRALREVIINRVGTFIWGFAFIFGGFILPVMSYIALIISLILAVISLFINREKK